MEHDGFSVFGVRFSGIAVAMEHGGCSVFRNRKRAAIDANRKLKTENHATKPLCSSSQLQ
jgi:hypothetical protein